jgi:hypothetical protein
VDIKYVVGNFSQGLKMKSITNSTSGHYNIFDAHDDGIEHIKKMFPDAKATELNFILFSTSGAHGTYTTIEEVEKDRELSLTFLIIHPRLVTMKYGVLKNLSTEDIQYLKKLRESSKNIIQKIG